MPPFPSTPHSRKNTLRTSNSVLDSLHRRAHIVAQEGQVVWDQHVDEVAHKYGQSLPVGRLRLIAPKTFEYPLTHVIYPLPNISGRTNATESGRDSGDVNRRQDNDAPSLGHTIDEQLGESAPDSMDFEPQTDPRNTGSAPTAAGSSSRTPLRSTSPAQATGSASRRAISRPIVFKVLPNPNCAIERPRPLERSGRSTSDESAACDTPSSSSSSQRIPLSSLPDNASETNSPSKKKGDQPHKTICRRKEKGKGKGKDKGKGKGKRTARNGDAESEEEEGDEDQSDRDDEGRQVESDLRGGKMQAKYLNGYRLLPFVLHGARNSLMTAVKEFEADRPPPKSMDSLRDYPPDQRLRFRVSAALRGIDTCIEYYDEFIGLVAKFDGAGCLLNKEQVTMWCQQKGPSLLSTSTSAPASGSTPATVSGGAQRQGGGGDLQGRGSAKRLKVSNGKELRRDG